MNEWVETIETLLHHCNPACVWFVEYLSCEQGKTYIKYVLSVYCYNSMLLDFCMVWLVSIAEELVQ